MQGKKLDVTADFLEGILILIVFLGGKDFTPADVFGSVVVGVMWSMDTEGRRNCVFLFLIQTDSRLKYCPHSHMDYECNIWLL